MNARRELFSAGLLAVAGVASAFLPMPTLVRVALALPLALILPGFALMRAAVPDRRQDGEWWTLAVGLSVSLCVIAGLALNVVGHLDPKGWALGLGVFTTICVAAARRRAPVQSAPDTAPLRVSAFNAALFTLSLGIAASAVYFAARNLDTHREYQFTEFWMTPQGRYDQSLVTIGLRNLEAKPMGYDVSVVADGAVVGRWPAISVGPGATWSTDFALSGSLRKSRVEAWLYRADDPTELYRKVWLSPLTATAER